MISKSCKHAIRAAIFIASRASEESKPGVREIASEIEAPTAFTAKILQILSKAEIINSIKGPYGGFFCEEFQLGVPILAIVRAVDGETVFRECVLGLHQCSDDHPCPMHFHYAAARDEIRRTFENISLRDLVEDYTLGNTFLTNK